MSAGFRISALLRGLAGGVFAGIIGFMIFSWILGQGFYALIVPGAAVGFGFGTAARGRCTVYGIVSAIIGLGVSLYTEWSFFPFKADPGFGYFIAHAHQLKPVSLLMIAVGTASAYWFGVGRDSFPQPRARIADESGSAE